VPVNGTWLAIAFGAFGTCLLIALAARIGSRFWESKPHISPPLPPQKASSYGGEAEPLPITITEGYFCPWLVQRSTQLLLLHFRVDYPIRKTVKEWTLKLERDGKPWKVAYMQKLNQEKCIFAEFDDSMEYRKALTLVNRTNNPIPLDDPVDPIPLIGVGERGVKSPTPILGQFIPDRGWVLFSVTGAGDRFPELLFGATFLISGIAEENKVTLTGKQLADEWLHRGIIQDAM
jgi:hypothetical protein